MQVIFITDIRQVTVVANVGWAMIALTMSMIFINFIVIVIYTVRSKLFKPNEVNGNMVNQAEFVNYDNSHRSSAVTIMRYSNMPRSTRRL